METENSLANSEENPKATVETEAVLEKRELDPEEIVRLASVAQEAISGKRPEGEITAENFKEVLEKSMLEAVNGLLDELLAEKLGTVDAKALNKKAQELLQDILQEKDLQKLSELQIKLIHQYISTTSAVQNGGDKGFTPSIAREVDGMDCSLSAWVLKEKLQGAGVEFEFGYLPGHAVGVVTLADKRKVYVDAQNGIIEEVNLEEVANADETDKKLALAHNIFEVKRVSGEKVAIMRKDGSEYTPKYIGLSKDGLLHTLGNMFMFANPQSPTFYSETGRKFREGIGMSEMEPEVYGAGKTAMENWQADKAPDEEMNKYFAQAMGDNLQKGIAYLEVYKTRQAKFQVLVEKIAGGQTIMDDKSKFGILERQNHAGYQAAQDEIRDKEEIERLKKEIA